MPHAKILIVEDELSHQMILKKSLGDRYEITAVKSLSDAMSLIDETEFDLFLLDVMLEDGNGYHLCTEIRKRSNLKHKPIIFLSARSGIESKVLGLNLGADDYIVKPCNPTELLARISNRLKKHQEITGRGQQFAQGTLLFDLERQEVKCLESSESFELTPLEFRLLYYLARNTGQTFDRKSIIDNVWNEKTNVLERSVDTYVASLRRKMGGYGKAIRSVHGVGYTFQIKRAA